MNDLVGCYTIRYLVWCTNVNFICAGNSERFRKSYLFSSHKDIQMFIHGHPQDKVHFKCGTRRHLLMISPCRMARVHGDPLSQHNYLYL